MLRNYTANLLNIGQKSSLGNLYQTALEKVSSGFEVYKATSKDQKTPSQSADVSRHKREKKIYPEETNLITKIDNRLIQATAKIHDTAHSLFGIKKTLLAQVCLLSAPILITPYMTTFINLKMAHNIQGAGALTLILLAGGSAALSQAYQPDFKTPIEEENQILNSPYSINKDMFKYFRVAIFSASLLLVPLSIRSELAQDFSQNFSFIISNMVAISLLPYAFAQYLLATGNEHPPQTPPHDHNDHRGHRVKRNEMQPVPVKVRK